MSSFTPKQAIPRGEKLFQVVGGEETIEVAQHILNLIPPIPANAVIHDNACGPGAVTEAISKRYTPPIPFTIHATDLNAVMARIYNTKAANQSWPTKASIMDAAKLDFPDETFTHSFLDFGLPIMKDPTAAAKEMYRTLKPGGIAITTFWIQNPHGSTGVLTSRTLRGGMPLKIEPPPGFEDPDLLSRMLASGGFEKSSNETTQKEVSLEVKAGEMDFFVDAIWSAIGEPAGGWSVKDEAEWEEATGLYKRLLKEAKGHVLRDDGSVTLNLIANIAVAIK